jgi:hypothetical protein
MPAQLYRCNMYLTHLTAVDKDSCCTATPIPEASTSKNGNCSL